jgi:putative GTP pyrophosphokinase
MNKNNLKKEYDNKKFLFQKIQEEASRILSQEINIKRIQFILHKRIKKFESFYDKIHKKEIKSPFEEIHDIIGLRIVCLFLSDIKKITNIIEKHFDIVKDEDKIISDDLKRFGYMARHFDVKFKDASLLNQDFKNIVFEIQLRTIVQDAWASISHELDYKTEDDLQSDFKRDFYALSGLFYIADVHFENLKKEQIKQLTKINIEGI